VSTISRGKSYEREAIKILEKQGWLVEHAVNKTVYTGGRIISIAHDFFHMFDIIAKKPAFTTRWIQVSYRKWGINDNQHRMAKRRY